MENNGLEGQTSAFLGTEQLRSLILKEGKGHSPECLKESLLINIFLQNVCNVAGSQQVAEGAHGRLEHVIPWLSYNTTPWSAEGAQAEPWTRAFLPEW